MYSRTIDGVKIVSLGEGVLPDDYLPHLCGSTPHKVKITNVIYWYKVLGYNGYGTVIYEDSLDEWHIDILDHCSYDHPYDAYIPLNYQLRDVKKFLRRNCYYKNGGKEILAYLEPRRANRSSEDARKTVLDPCCGGRMFYFDKHHPLVMYGDIRRESVSMTDRGKLRSLDITPDVILDFTNMPFLDDSFNFVVFDPPHLINCGKNSWLAKKYGKLDKYSWQDTLSAGLSECIRVVKPGCVVAMKWSEGDISTTKLLKALPYQPVFGDKQGKKRWLFFIKGMKGE